MKTKLSIVIPTYNEKDNVVLLYKELVPVLKKLNHTYEIIYVDDGSTDGTREQLKALHKQDKRVKVLFQRKNFGQTAAMDAGFKYAKGEIIIAIDADLQNDPADIPKLLEKMNQGYDVVSSWRKNRKDPFTKKILSRFAGLLRKILVKEKIHDSGCTFKLYKKECFDNLDLFGELHRYIPAILQWRGFRIGEIVINHRPRKHGKSKYGAGRLTRGFFDLLAVTFWMRYGNRPIQLFGGIGLTCFVLGFLGGIWLLIEKFVYKLSLANRPLLLLVILLIIIGVQFFGMGIMTDILVKIYYRNSPVSTTEKILE